MGGLLPENRIKLLAQQVFTTAIDLVFPPFCVGCDRVGSFLCPRCMATLVPAPAREVAGLDGVKAAVNYEGAVRRAIHALKYERQRRVAEPLGRLLTGLDWPVDLVTAVPLHPKRLQERGYNQAALVAQTVAQLYQWEFADDILQRTRETTSQVQLSAQERQANVEGAFDAVTEKVRGKRLLVIDDVLTTGATMAACADALRRAGAIQVFGATVAGSMYDVHTGAVDAPV